MTEFKEMIFTKWAECGLTCQDAKNILNGKAELVKISGDKDSAGIADILYKYIPMISFGLPAVAGSLYYMMTNPSELEDELAKDRMKELSIKEKELKAKALREQKIRSMGF